MSLMTDTLKAASRNIGDVMLDDDGLDLGQVYKDQVPEFFIGISLKLVR